MIETRPLLPALPHVVSPPPALPPPRETATDLMAQARQQADSGQLEFALDLCRKAQERFGHTAEIYTLLGIIHQARHDRDQAAQAFRKALYLEPDCRDALVHLMLLFQEQGDQTQAVLLRKRLDRLAPAPGDST